MSAGSTGDIHQSFAIMTTTRYREERKNSRQLARGDSEGDYLELLAPRAAAARLASSDDECPDNRPYPDDDPEHGKEVQWQR